MQQPIRLITRISLVVPLVLLGFSFGCQQQVPVVITDEEANALVAGLLEVYNEGNFAITEDVFSPDFVLHHCGFPEDLVGIDAFEGFVTENRTAFPDFKLTMDEFFVRDDKMASRWTVTGTQTGPLRDLPPTGNKIELSGLGISRVANGKFAEEWLYFNMLDLYQQLGFTLVPPQAESKNSP
jgi:steroid delta-isomerase-like uncharacterized protein